MTSSNSAINQKPKILVIDDSATDRQMVVTAIREGGFTNEILEAGDGQKALEILSKNHKAIGLICLDWQMPKIDGMEFMRGVIRVPQTAQIPIIMVTASGSEEAQKCAHRVNPQLTGYIVKPFKAKDFIDVISRHLT